MQEVEVIHSWSVPRSLSTCLMYSFSQRDDIEVLDEPLYVPYLRLTGAKRPYRDELLSTMENDADKVMKEAIFAPGNKPYRYCKHIAKQCLPGVKAELLKKGKHFILIRNPLHSLASFDKVIPSSFTEIGLPDLVSVYCELRELGKTPPIIDAVNLQLDPEGTLRALCKDLDIPFQPAMLKWEAGPKAVDGVFAPWWYKDVHKTTCFLPPKKYPKPFPMEMYDLLEECLPFYNFLKNRAKKTPFTMSSSLPLPQNKKLLVWVGDEVVPRAYAKVSVFDSVVQDGGSVWEGLKVYNGRIFKLDEHLDRLFDSAKELALDNVPTRDEVKEAIFATLIRNDMFDNVYIRLSLTRGNKVTSGTNPAFNLYGCTLIVLPEWNSPVYDNPKGIKVVTATTQNSPKIELHNANADHAIMLDRDDYVSETNSTSIFLVKRGRVMTPHTDHCLAGIIRSTVMDLAANEGLIIEETRISLSELHTADEVFTIGTMGEITPVVEIDGGVIGDGNIGIVTLKLQRAFKNLTLESGELIPTYQNP